MQKDWQIKLRKGDCLEIMKNIPDKSIDCIICDLPYGKINCLWDTVISFNSLWQEYKRITKDNAAILLFGSEPFSTKLRESCLQLYRYDWYWIKSKPSLYQHAKKIGQ